MEYIHSLPEIEKKKKKGILGFLSKCVLFHLILSQEIADGVNKSAQAVQAAEAGIRQIGSVARQQTMCKMLHSSTL